jgi:hypothetical protein
MDKTKSLRDYFYPNVSTREMEPEGNNPPSNQDTVDPSASLEEVIALATADPSPPRSTTPATPYERLYAIIQADRHPPGQRALFAAIDVLRPGLSHEDAATGFDVALKLLHETLENAIEDPAPIQQHRHVREKLKADYLRLREEVPVDGRDMDALIHGIKDKLGGRWRVEAMAQQKSLF